MSRSFQAHTSPQQDEFVDLSCCGDAGKPYQ